VATDSKTAKKPGGAKRTRQTGDESIRARNEQVILDAAVTVFSTKGFDGARVVDIATKSKLPLANVYYYFGSKEEVYRRVIMRLLTNWDSIFTNIEATREPAEAFAAYVREHFSYTWRHLSETRLFATELISGARFMTKEQRVHIQEITDARAKVVEGWIAAGKLAQVDVRQLFMLLWAASQYYASYETIVADTLSTTRVTKRQYEIAAEAVTDIVLNGVLPRTAASRKQRNRSL
jgi:TetR/AcrR family transcriptional regulator